jgi:hypothetical protein
LSNTRTYWGGTDNATGVFVGDDFAVADIFLIVDDDDDDDDRFIVEVEEFRGLLRGLLDVVALRPIPLIDSS